MTAKQSFNHLHFSGANGEMILRSPHQLEPYPNQLGFYLQHWAIFFQNPPLAEAPQALTRG